MGCSGFRLRSAVLEDLVVEAQAFPTMDSPPMGEILRRFDDLAGRFAARLTVCKETREDIKNAALFGLAEAVMRHRQGLGAFESYGPIYMRFAALREHKVWFGRPGDGRPTLEVLDEDMDSMQVLTATTEDIADDGAPWDDSTSAVEEVLTEGQMVLLERRYVLDLDLQEIADLEGVSRPAISQRLATVHRYLVEVLAA